MRLSQKLARVPFYLGQLHAYTSSEPTIPATATLSPNWTGAAGSSISQFRPPTELARRGGLLLWCGRPGKLPLVVFVCPRATFPRPYHNPSRPPQCPTQSSCSAASGSRGCRTTSRISFDQPAPTGAHLGLRASCSSTARRKATRSGK